MLTDVLTDQRDPLTMVVLTRWGSSEYYERHAVWRQTSEGATYVHEIAAGPPPLRRLKHVATYIPSRGTDDIGADRPAQNVESGQSDKETS